MYRKMDAKKWIFVMVTVLPGFFFFCLFTLWPNILSVYYSFLKWSGVTDPVWVGFDNYVKMFADKYVWAGLKVNISILLVQVPITFLISIALAHTLVQRGFRENGFYKVLFFFPNVLPSVIVATLWKFIYDGDMGLLNSVIRIFDPDFALWWLGDKSIVLYMVIIPMIWTSVGFNMIIYMNAMMSVPPSLYEAATLDGASEWQKLREVTLPLIIGPIKVTMVFLILSAIKSFEMIMLMTAGGPANTTRSLGLYMYYLAFGAQGDAVGYSAVPQYGYASAVGMLIMVISLAIKLMTDRLLFKEQDVQY